MKNTLRNKTKSMLSLVLSVLLCSVFALLSFSAEDDFESKIAAFPESYKPYLRELHIAHPEWEFEPFFTYLDFYEAVDNECGIKSLVSSSVTSNIFKSKDSDDYDYDKGTYELKDPGFVEANRLAVAYFMDPRNFLNADGIFQFETLAFSETYTTAVIENILKGSFMYDTKITYFDADGKKVKTKTKYSKAIYNAGKKYNINPCFLASKILNEVGTSGSKSVTGNYEGYPGIYNFYNIGAYDGKEPIAKGLKWASTGTTYSRPWNTPVKSIEGGAKYIVELYIACGQFTGYLQRFNVNPNGKHSIYTHQYMTNLTGALSQGYSTYVSYTKSGILDNKIKFSIPVYENMPSDTNVATDGCFIDSLSQTGKMTASSSFVRTGPSTYYAKLLDKSGAEIKLTSGTAVTILDKTDTDSNYYLSILQYPYWCKVSFVYNGDTYEGYVPENFIDITTEVVVGIGEFSPSISTTNDTVCMDLISYDCNIARITADNKINFLKSGTVDIAAYDSSGSFDKVKYTVVKTPSDTETKVALSDITPNTVVVNFNEVKTASGYEIIVCDGTGKIIHKAVTKTAAPYTVTGLDGAAGYSVFVRAVFGKSAEYKYGPYASSSLVTLPDNVTISRVNKDSSGKVTINWEPLGSVSEYQIFTYDTESDVYTQIDTAEAEASSYKIPSEFAEENCFAVRAVEVIGESELYGDYSDIVDIRNIPAKCSGTNVTSVTDSGYTITWNKLDGVRYFIYRMDSGSYQRLKSVGTPTYKVTKAGLSAYKKYKISAYKKIDGIVYEGVASRPFSATTTPATITNLKVSATPKGGKFTWKAVSNASNYIVYIYKESKGKYVKKATVKTNSYTMSDKKPGKPYKIQVKACIKTTYGDYFGKTATVSFYTTPEKVSDVKFSSITTDSLKISWEKTGGTSRYYIYQYSSKKKKYVKIGETKKNSYSVSGLKAGTTYKFKIKSVKLVDGKSVSSSTSSVLKTSTRLTKTTKVTAKSWKEKMTLSWASVKGATHYRVYMYNSTKKKYVRLATVKGGTKYTVKGLKAGGTYKFKIRPLKVLDGKKYLGSYSAVYTFRTKS